MENATKVVRANRAPFEKTSRDSGVGAMFAPRLFLQGRCCAQREETAQLAQTGIVLHKAHEIRRGKGIFLVPNETKSHRFSFKDTAFLLDAVLIFGAELSTFGGRLQSHQHGRARGVVQEWAYRIERSLMTTDRS
jgi:hypothetical protein